MSVNINKHIADILQLHEYSMSIGRTLDFDKNCDNFLKLLLARKNLSGCCVISKKEDEYIRSYSYPVGLVDDKMMEHSDFLNDCFKDETIKTGMFVEDEEEMNSSCRTEGSWLFFNLKNNKGLMLINHKGSPFDEVEINQLSPIMDKFSISLKACESFTKQDNLLKRLTSQNKELREFTQAISHDLKSPLRNIVTLIAWTKEDGENLQEDVVQNLENIEYNIEKMDNLIKGLHTYSTIDKFEENDKEIDLEPFLGEIIESLIIPDEVQFHIESNASKLFMYPTLFQNLFYHLISNAVNSMDKEKGEIYINIKEEESYLKCSVRDNGKGIPEKYRERIFQLFESIDSKKECIGIGLPIVKKIVDYYKGDIRLESEVGKGTTLFFTLQKE
ncbi:His Kinase A (phospho-acceptor) domain-containing protein [Aquimarina amphilecti]|uniref:histidine kinase n=1 Tax=Aquimarina amphilecti TaxID=1038014 RepID=A0A1H7S1S0_AQUAM|nr:HAMP domain-containing sensor histidine kinase [Aquimarina amphilecti]SEL66239.1 His Kinase A (phospho-acceptor) domain-containing protein [Aquimarina amphilecti]